jgi:hypothetical protein
MPPLTTHLHFAWLLLPKLGIEGLAFPFVLGTAAPDCFEYEDQESFHRFHFSHEDDHELARFDREVIPTIKSLAPASIAFIFGYRAHLHLDEYFNQYGTVLSPEPPHNINEAEARRQTRAAANFHDRPAALRLLSLAFKKGQVDQLFVLPEALAFIPLSTARQSLADLQAKLQTGPVPPESGIVLDGTAYRGFLEEAARQAVLQLSTL